MTEPIRLELAVEVASYSLVDLPAPDPGAPDPEWKRYFAACDAAVGIDASMRLPDSRALHPVDGLEPSLLERVVDEELTHVEEVLDRGPDSWAIADLDVLTGLDGGIAVRSLDGGRIAYPGCCCDLGHVAEWREALASLTDRWQRPWCGHDEEQVALRAAEADQVDVEVIRERDGSRHRFTVAATFLDAELARLEHSAERLATDLERILAGSVADAQVRREFARTFAGLGES